MVQQTSPNQFSTIDMYLVGAMAMLGLLLAPSLMPEDDAPYTVARGFGIILITIFSGLIACWHLHASMLTGAERTIYVGGYVLLGWATGLSIVYFGWTYPGIFWATTLAGLAIGRDRDHPETYVGEYILLGWNTGLSIVYFGWTGLSIFWAMTLAGFTFGIYRVHSGIYVLGYILLGWAIGLSIMYFGWTDPRVFWAITLVGLALGKFRGHSEIYAGGYILLGWTTGLSIIYFGWTDPRILCAITLAGLALRRYRGHTRKYEEVDRIVYLYFSVAGTWATTGILMFASLAIAKALSAGCEFLF